MRKQEIVFNILANPAWWLLTSWSALDSTIKVGRIWTYSLQIKSDEHELRPNYDLSVALQGLKESKIHTFFCPHVSNQWDKFNSFTLESSMGYNRLPFKNESIKKKLCLCTLSAWPKQTVFTICCILWKLLPWKLKACSNRTLSSTVHSSGKGVKLGRSARDFSMLCLCQKSIPKAYIMNRQNTGGVYK